MRPRSSTEALRTNEPPHDPASPLSGITREDALHLRFGRAVQNVKRLESEMDRAFEELCVSEADLASCGVKHSLEFRPPTLAARQVWQREREVASSPRFLTPKSLSS